MKRLTTFVAIACLLLIVPVATATEFHVSVKGNNNNDGSPEKPYKTISAAAQAAYPGDVITVHEGVYRERINPPRGGESDTKRIVYQAVAGEKVEIKGSEVVKNWVKIQGDVWKVTLPNAFFGNFNPYNDPIHGNWFNPKGRKHHTGAVYFNGDWLTEAAKLDDVLKPTGTTSLWFAEAGDGNTMIWAQFKGGNPNEQLAEINVRQTVFYPSKPGTNYITVHGFTIAMRPRRGHHQLPSKSVWLGHTGARAGSLKTMSSATQCVQASRSASTATNGTINRSLLGAMSRPSSVPSRTDGTGKQSANTSFATIPSPTANRRASSAA